MVQLSAYKEQKQVVNDLIKEITINPADDIELNPLHSVYSQGQHLLSVLIELLQDFPELNKHYAITNWFVQKRRCSPSFSPAAMVSSRKSSYRRSCSIASCIGLDA